MVATGVADKAGGRIGRVIYLDAFAPRNGQSLFDLLGPQGEANMRAGAAKEGDGWRIPPIPAPPDTSPEDVAWTAPRRRPQPIKTFEQRIQLTSAELPPRHYIYAKKFRPGDVFRQFADRAKSEPGWTYHEIDASHNPHITCPDVLMALLTQIMSGQ
jgi:hypothetical protein